MAQRSDPGDSNFSVLVFSPIVRAALMHGGYLKESPPFDKDDSTNWRLKELESSEEARHCDTTSVTPRHPRFSPVRTLGCYVG